MNRKILYIGLPALLLLGLIAWKIRNASAAADPRRASAPIVKVEAPARQDVRVDLRFTGDVVPIRQANIYAKVGGALERVWTDMGAAVRDGQMLALIDTTELSQQVAQASASAVNARLNYERTKELAAQNLVAQQDLDNAEAAMKIAGANDDAARTRLGYARITAPFGGVVTKRFLDAGATVSANTTTLFTLMDLDAMKIIVNVLERDIPLVAAGKKAIVTVDAFPGRQFDGSITRLSEAVDLATRTMAIEVDIPNRDHVLKPGMFATVTLLVAERKNALTIPTMSILKDDKGAYVYVIDGGVARRRSVKPGTDIGTRTEILAGLSGGEQLVVVGQQFLKDGGPAQVQ